MSTNNPRYDSIAHIEARQPRKFEQIKDKSGNRLKVSEYYGSNTFSMQAMKEKLPRDTYQKIMVSIETGKKLDKESANTIAHIIKDWALEKGVTHFCHWFQPQTGLTAEKHDAFISIDDNGVPIEKFSGSQLIQSEPDASSFPSGGMRTTFEARGYTAWDPSSPVFIIESTNGNTLCIPSLFISYHGDALDEKTPLLRSMEALNQHTCELLTTMGYKGTKRVVSTMGPEQEYFLIDKRFYNLRPDLIMTGRTLLGAQPPRGQQLEDHYFGSIPSRVLSFMQEVEYELYKLGVPAKTRHNEVAPNQYEAAPIFEEANLAADHNQLVMDMMKKVASRHSFTLLLHEKPFAGVNGSGKHCNWSMALSMDGAEDSVNLLDPGKDPHQNIRFLMMLAAVLKGVYKHSGLMRASIAMPGNDHRLGANEAPPAIISAFLGQQLNEICNKIVGGVNFENNPEEAVISLGVSKIPTISKDNTDRNRTSPFAFTGNKFEFRAVGSSMPISFPVTVVNAAVAEAMAELNETLKADLKNHKSVEAAVLALVKKTLSETTAIRFEGNNYSEAWVAEAAKRGLPNLRKAPEAIEELNKKEAISLFTKMKIFSEGEVHSRYHIMIERYVKKLMIEVDTLGAMIDTYIIPAALKEQQSVALSIRAAQEASKEISLTEQQKRLAKIAQSINSMITKRSALAEFANKVNSMSDEKAKAVTLSNEGLSMMNELRAISDQLEEMVGDEHWPLPKYREMLFIS